MKFAKTKKRINFEPMKIAYEPVVNLVKIGDWEFLIFCN